jgi:hypothetical protein
MKCKYRLLGVATLTLSLACFMAASPAQTAPTSPGNSGAALPECKVALRMVTSTDYLRDHSGEIPDADKLDDDAKAAFVADLFRKTVGGIDQPGQYCTNTIHDNLRYTSTYHLPQQCMDFMPLLKKNFEDKVEYKKDQDQFVQQKLDETVMDMLVLDETAPQQLVQRCEVGIKVMQVDLNDRHLKEKYPLPVACEVMFAEMEKSMILPSQLETIRRQRVLFVIENRDNPKKLDEICDEITK